MSPFALDRAGTLACLFELASQTFGVEISQAREARVFDDYTVVPLAPSHLIGVANLRGAIIPILDLRVPLTLRVPAHGAKQSLTYQGVVAKCCHLSSGIFNRSNRSCTLPRA